MSRSIYGRCSRGLAVALALCFVPVVVRAQNGSASSATDLAKASQNPISDLVSVPAQFNFFSGGDLGDRSLYNLNLQPNLPFRLNRDWMLVSRTIVPYFSMPVSGARVTGIGDIQQQFFFALAEPGELTWGAGPMFSLPTATNEMSRTGAWGIGPAFVALRIVDPFLAGFMLTHVWTFADYENDRPNISTMNLQPFVNWNLADGWAIQTAPILIGNWTAPDGDQWTIPIGLGFSKVVTVGRQPLSLGMQYYHNIARPEGTGADQLKLVASFLFPKEP
jgi:hypothetical protein